MMKKYAEIYGVESIDDDMEEFDCRINGMPVKFTMSRTKNKKLFMEMMDCMRDGLMIDVDKILSEMEGIKQ